MSGKELSEARENDEREWQEDGAARALAGLTEPARCEAWIDGKASVLCNRLLPCPMHSGEPARGNSDEEVCPVCEGTGYTDGVTVRHPCFECAVPSRLTVAAERTAAHVESLFGHDRTEQGAMVLFAADLNALRMRIADLRAALREAQGEVVRP